MGSERVISRQSLEDHAFELAVTLTTPGDATAVLLLEAWLQL